MHQNDKLYSDKHPRLAFGRFGFDSFVESDQKIKALIFTVSLFEFSNKWIYSV